MIAGMTTAELAMAAVAAIAGAEAAAAGARVAQGREGDNPRVLAGTAGPGAKRNGVSLRR